jgi:hypothetical protein
MLGSGDRRRPCVNGMNVTAAMTPDASWVQVMIQPLQAVAPCEQMRAMLASMRRQLRGW